MNWKSRNLLPPVAIILAGVLIGLALAAPGCSTARIRETYQHGLAAAPPASTIPADITQKNVTRTVSATRIMSFAGSSPGETISHVKPLSVTDAGADFGGMEPVAEAARGPILLVSAGILCALAGAAVLIFVTGGRTIGLCVMGLGAVFIVAGLAFEVYPWAALVLLGVAGVGAAVWFYFSVRNSKRVQQTLQIVAAGIEQTPDNDAVKENITAAAATRANREVVKEVVSDIKKKL